MTFIRRVDSMDRQTDKEPHGGSCVKGLGLSTCEGFRTDRMMGSLKRETRAGGGICSCIFRGWEVFKARVGNLALLFPDGAKKGNGWLWCELTFQVRVLAPRSLLAWDSQTVSQ